MEIRPSGNIIHNTASVDGRAAVASPASTTATVTKIEATPVLTAAAVQQPAPATNIAQVSEALKKINDSMRQLSQALEFSLDEDSDRTIVKIVDQQTKEVIRQVPTEEALEIAKALDKVQGLLLRDKA